jgi:hypothetical protein
MITFARCVAATVLCLGVSLSVGCGGDDGGGGGGRGGGTAGSGSGAAGTGGGAAGTGGGAAGTGGGGGAAATCQTCLACVQSNCGTAIATCQANTACNAIYECARMCTIDANDCVMMNLGGVQAWAASVSACLNMGCLTPCSSYLGGT